MAVKQLGEGGREHRRPHIDQADVGGPRHLLERMAEKHTAALRRWAVVRGASHADAADLVQETFEKTLKARPPVRNDDELRAWLFVVLRHQLVNKHRAVAAFTSVPCDMLALSAREPEALPLWRQIDIEVVQDALSRLPATLRTTFELRVAGHRPREIAGILGISDATVAVRLHRARHQLRVFALAAINPGAPANLGDTVPHDRPGEFGGRPRVDHPLGRRRPNLRSPR